MSVNLRDRLAAATSAQQGNDLLERFGVMENPFPASSQTLDNPHFRLPIDDDIDARIESFVRDRKSQVVIVVGTQGTGKTNVLNYYERQLKDALGALNGYYIVRYLADPEASFDSTLRRLFQELGPDHLIKLGQQLRGNITPIELAKSHEVRVALQHLGRSGGSEAVAHQFQEWLLGLRLLKIHRETLGVNFRLDTVESKTVALRDIVEVSREVGLLNGIFLLLDEVEKQAGILSATAVVRYLSSLRAVIDALPTHLFMMMAVTPDALIRYSLALPAFRSRLENRVELQPLTEASDASDLVRFYVGDARKAAAEHAPKKKNFETLILDEEVEDLFARLLDRAKRRSDVGVRQREFLHYIHQIAEKRITEDRTLRGG